MNVVQDKSIKQQRLTSVQHPESGNNGNIQDETEDECDDNDDDVMDLDEYEEVTDKLDVIDQTNDRRRYHYGNFEVELLERRMNQVADECKVYA